MLCFVCRECYPLTYFSSVAIFHGQKAKQVVQTWEREFHSIAREQRVPSLCLANDILQNSRRKGGEFVTEFWKVLSGALRDVLENGDDRGRNAVYRLVDIKIHITQKKQVDIWEERKVFWIPRTKSS